MIPPIPMINIYFLIFFTHVGDSSGLFWNQILTYIASWLSPFALAHLLDGLEVALGWWYLWNLWYLQFRLHPSPCVLAIPTSHDFARGLFLKLDRYKLPIQFFDHFLRIFQIVIIGYICCVSLFLWVGFVEIENCILIVGFDVLWGYIMLRQLLNHLLTKCIIKLTFIFLRLQKWFFTNFNCSFESGDRHRLFFNMPVFHVATLRFVLLVQNSILLIQQVGWRNVHLFLYFLLFT